MFEIIMKIWFLIFILPYTMAKEGWAKLAAFLDREPGRWDKFWYSILGALLLWLLILLSMGYR